MTNEEIIYSAAKKNGIPDRLALFIVAQAKHETNNFSSNVFKSCKNAFGYKYVGQYLSSGACTGSPEGNSYAAYATVNNSVKELCLWISRRQLDGKFPQDLTQIKTLDQYAQLLKLSGYYGDSISNYLAGLTYWFKENIRPITGGGLAMLAAIFFFAFKGRKKR